MACKGLGARTLLSSLFHANTHAIAIPFPLHSALCHPFSPHSLCHSTSPLLFFNRAHTPLYSMRAFSVLSLSCHSSPLPSSTPSLVLFICPSRGGRLCNAGSQSHPCCSSSRKMSRHFFEAEEGNLFIPLAQQQ